MMILMLNYITFILISSRLACQVFSYFLLHMLKVKSQKRGSKMVYFS